MGATTPARAHRDRRRLPPVALLAAAGAAMVGLGQAALAPRPADAHPLAQGALDASVERERIQLDVTVPADEILIAAAAHGRAQAPSDEKLRLHAAYLLAHLQVDADGRRLVGRVVKAPGPEDEPLVYQLEYAIPGGRAPSRIVLREDVLRDVGTAWGGPWEVSFLTAIAQAGGAGGAGEGAPARAAPRLLTYAEPLAFDCDWGGGASAALTVGARARLAAAYVRQGIWHILGGWDHLLFIAALLLAAATVWDLVKVVLAFTIAHGTTLALCALGLIRVRASLIEPVIAASIVVVALQNVVAPASSRRAPRLVLAFLFGLFHGCGFATGVTGAMQAYAGSGVSVAVIVVAFSLGVEIGHQILVIPAFVLLARLRAWLRARGMADAGPRLQRYGSIAIAAGGAFYLWSALR